MTASLTQAIAELQTQIEALGTATATVTPGGLVAQIALVQGILASLQAALTAGVQAPTVSFQFDAVLQLKAKLTALLKLKEQLAAGGIHAFAYRGRADDFGRELADGIATSTGTQPSDAAVGVALVATAPAAIAALGACFIG